MTESQVKSIISDIGNIHYPQATTEQLKEIRSRIGDYSETAAVQAVQEYARRHEFLNVERLIAAIAERSLACDDAARRERRRRVAEEASQIEDENASMDAEVGAMPDDDFADAVEELRRRGDLPERILTRGRGSQAVRAAVFQLLRSQTRSAR